MIIAEHFGKTAEGREVLAFTLQNNSGAFVKILNYGCTVNQIVVPDRSGTLSNVCLSYPSIEEYEKNSGYFGAAVGRYANRIADAVFRLNGQAYPLAQNDNGNHLHGGIKGFDRFVWEHKLDGDTLRFSRLSPHMEEGYPGNLSVQVSYHFGEDNALSIAYDAKSDQDTICNLTNHSYFNLKGSGSILGHTLQIHADHFTPIDGSAIPTGEIRPVSGTPFDFRTPKKIGAQIGEDCEQIQNGKGYDHNFVLSGSGLAEAATVSEPESGRRMTVLTTQPGVQFYSGNFITSCPYRPREGFCLETQTYPDAPNQASFPSPVLAKGARYHHETVYRFSVQNG